MKTILKLLAIPFLFTILITTSCLKDDESAPYVPKAALRMINAYSNAEAIVFSTDNNYLTPLGNPLRYNEYTTSLALIYPGNRRIKVYSNDNALVSDTTINLKDSTYYSSFVFGNTPKAKNLITTDISIPNLDGNSAIRFLHLATNIGNVNVKFSTNTNNIYENRSPEVLATAPTPANEIFKKENPGKRKITITDMNNNILVEREYDFLSSRYYTIILTGDKNSSSKPLYLGIIQQ